MKHLFKYTSVFFIGVALCACDGKKAPKTKVETPIIKTVEPTEIKADTTVIEETIVKEEVEKIAPTKKGPYYVVVASFVSEANAQKVMEQYTQKGYAAGITSRAKGQNPEFFRLYLDNSDNKSEALASARKISKELDLKAWVLVNH